MERCNLTASFRQMNSTAFISPHNDGSYEINKSENVVHQIAPALLMYYEPSWSGPLNELHRIYASKTLLYGYSNEQSPLFYISLFFLTVTTY